jgi:hypothetical protein
VPSRSVVLRLEERHLPIKKLALELSKIKNLNADYETLNELLKNKLDKDPLFSCFLFAAVKLSGDFEKGLVPQHFADIGILSKNFGGLFSNNVPVGCKMDDYQDVDLPPFLIQVLVSLLKDSLSSE